ncbi:MAG TPA: cytochrome P450 [Chloroflexota bacterium]|nr:cytochrome P450 [Chloroflexota bacterium]
MTTPTLEGVRAFDEIPIIEFPENYADTYLSFLAKTARLHGPVVRRAVPDEMHERFGAWFVYLIGPDANRFVLQTHRHLFSHDLGWTPALEPIMDRGLLNTDDPAHAWQRRLMNPAFAVAYMNRYVPLMSRVVERRTSDWLERGEVDLYEESREITFDVAAEALVGLESGATVDRLRYLFVQLLHGETNVDETFEEFMERVIRARTELDEMLLRLIAERRRSPTDDILGMLVSAHDEDGHSLSDRELLGQVHILLVAGHETTTTLNAWLLYLLASHPAYLGRVHAELDAALGAADGALDLKALRGLRLLGYAMDEAGRLYPPVAALPRGTVADVTFGGYVIPAGTQIRLVVGACHRLPEIFAEPDRFDPDRFAPPREEGKANPYALAIFGGGPRICIGINFAQIEMRIAAAHILRHFSLEPIPQQPVVHRYYGVTPSIPSGIHVRVHERRARTDG